MSNVDLIAAMLRERRKELGLTHARVAKRCGLTRETIYRVERGRSAIPDTLARIATALELPMEDLTELSPEDVALRSFPNRAVIRERRRSLGISMEACAAAAGISVATLSRFERGATTSRELVAFDASGRPAGLHSARLARCLDFATVEEMSRLWNWGRGAGAR